MKSIQPTTESPGRRWVSFFQKDGFCVVDNILNREECTAYLQEAERIAAEQPVKYAPLMNPDRTYPLFAELLAHKLMVAYLEIFQNSRIWGLQSMLYYRPPGSLGRDMHQDGYYAQAETGSYLGTFLPLEDTDRENGGLIVYPGSHREPILEVVEDEARKQTNVGDFKNDRGVPCVIPSGYEKTYLTVSAGSCVFIHSNLIHGSEENHSKTRFRRVFAGHYIKEGHSFVPGGHAKRKAIDLYGPSPTSINSWRKQIENPKWVLARK